MTTEVTRGVHLARSGRDAYVVVIDGVPCGRVHRPNGEWAWSVTATGPRLGIARARALFQFLAQLAPDSTPPIR